METTRKRILAGIGTVLLLLFGCLLFFLFGDQRTLKIGIFYGSNWEVPGTMHYDILDHAIKKYEKENPGVSVEYEEGIPSEEYSEWLAGSILKGEEPDVFIILDEDFRTLAKTGVLEPLDYLMQVDADRAVPEEEGTEDAAAEKDAGFYDSALRAGIYQERQYALPFECNPTLMFVNKTLLRQEGIDMPDDDWTWDDFYEICRQVVEDTDGDGQIDQFGYYGYTWEHAVYSNGIAPFDADGTDSSLDDERFAEAMRFVRRLNDTCQNFQVSANDFDLGKVVFRPLTFSDYRTYMPYPWRIKKYSDFEWTCIPMPAGPSGDNTSSMETLLMGISARTTKKKESWEFLKMLTMDEEIQELIYKDASGASALKNVTTSPEMMEFLNKDTPGGSDIDLSLLDATIEKAVPSQSFRAWQEAEERMDHVLTELTTSDEDIRTVLLNLTREIDEITHE